MNYKRAKRKYFRKRVEFWTLYHNRKKALNYGYGLFIPFKESNDIYTIMNMSDTDAFWYAYKLSVTLKKYTLKYRGYNNSCTVTFTSTK